MFSKIICNTSPCLYQPMRYQNIHRTSLSTCSNNFPVVISFTTLLFSHIFLLLYHKTFFLIYSISFVRLFISHPLHIPCTALLSAFQVFYFHLFPPPFPFLLYQLPNLNFSQQFISLTPVPRSFLFCMTKLHVDTYINNIHCNSTVRPYGEAR